MSRKIKIECVQCGVTHSVARDIDTPKTATGMKCSYCPNCNINERKEYKEWYILAEEKPKNKQQKSLF